MEMSSYKWHSLRCSPSAIIAGWPALYTIRLELMSTRKFFFFGGGVSEEQNFFGRGSEEQNFFWGFRGTKLFGGFRGTQLFGGFRGTKLFLGGSEEQNFTHVSVSGFPDSFLFQKDGSSAWIAQVSVGSTKKLAWRDQNLKRITKKKRSKSLTCTNLKCNTVTVKRDGKRFGNTKKSRPLHQESNLELSS